MIACIAIMTYYEYLEMISTERDLLAMNLQVAIEAGMTHRQCYINALKRHDELCEECILLGMLLSEGILSPYETRAA